MNKEIDCKTLTNWEAIVVRSNEGLKFVCDRNLPTTLNFDQIDEVAEELSEEHAWANLFVNYNQQIRNGGHQQYIDNGYHSSWEQGDFGYDEEGDVHQKLLKLTESLNEKWDLDIVRDKFIPVLKEFKLSVDKDEITEVWDDEEQDYVSEHNDNYGKPEEAKIGLFDKLDNDYLSFNVELAEQIGSKIKEKMVLQQDLKKITNKTEEHPKRQKKAKNKM